MELTKDEVDNGIVIEIWNTTGLFENNDNGYVSKIYHSQYNDKKLLGKIFGIERISNDSVAIKVKYDE